MGSKDFGEYLKAIEIHWDGWRCKQFCNRHFPLTQLNEVLRKANIDEISANAMHMRRFQLRIMKKEVQVQIMANQVLNKYLLSSVE